MRLFNIAAQCSLGALATMSLTSDALSQRPLSRDSAGIRIVENSSRLNAPIAFTLGAKPNFDVGGLEANPDDEFLPRGGYFRAIRLQDGRVAVLDKTRIHFFDASGKRIKITGRSGGGPGEFANITALCGTRGDTVLVSDSRRVSVLGKTGDFVALATFQGFSWAESMFCLDDGTFIGGASLPIDLQGRNGIRISHVARDGSILNRVADVSTGVFDMMIMRESATVAFGQRVYFGNALNHEIQMYTSSGKLASIIRTDDKLEPVTSSQLATQQPLVYRAGATQAEKRDQQRRNAALSKTKTWPTYDRMFVDLSGRLWVQDWMQRDKEAPDGWTAFDTTGKLIGRLIIPAPSPKDRRDQVLFFGRNEVLLRRYDADSAVHVTAYPLVPRK